LDAVIKLEINHILENPVLNLPLWCIHKSKELDISLDQTCKIAVKELSCYEMDVNRIRELLDHRDGNEKLIYKSNYRSENAKKTKNTKNKKYQNFKEKLNNLTDENISDSIAKVLYESILYSNRKRK